MTLRGIKTLLAITFLPLFVLAQSGSITGRVTDAETGDALVGANVVVDGTNWGAATDSDGNFLVASVAAGDYTLTATVIGYESATGSVSVAAGGSATVDFALTPGTIQLSSLEVLASRATRETPVAFSNITKAEMTMRLGSQDIPMIMNSTPSVYATEQGGGAGDSRINVRGFDQKNVTIMLNGVPVNDMENSWVYWSNWDGIGDATSSIQLQRGLSNVTLATPSIGGTMNIITDPTARTRGGSFRQEVGAWNFLKSTLNLNTGLIGDKLALSATIVRKTGDGFNAGTWTDAWAYYLSASYAVSAADRLELYVVGAPQRHGQTLYKQNVAAYSHEFAKEIIDPAMKNTDSDGDGTSDWDEYFAQFTEQGRNWNENVADVSESYKAKQYWYMYGARTVDRFSPTFLNERENFFHKPQINLNWYHNFSESMRMSTVAYFSGGSGGGTGTFNNRTASGSSAFIWAYGETDDAGNYAPYPSRVADWDANIAMNAGTVDRKGGVKVAGESLAILRNSINRQWTFGAISKFYLDLSDVLKIQVGVDWRTAEIEHAREVRDLLGGDYFVSSASDFDVTEEDKKKVLGDKIHYDNTNTVDWIGVFGQAEFRSGPISAYGTVGLSTVGYTFRNDFDKDDATGEAFYAEHKGLTGYQIKGGGMYRLSSTMGIFANFGLVQKTPIFDEAIDDEDGTVYTDPDKETFQSLEGGLNLSLMGGMLTANINGYFTNWLNRSRRLGTTSSDGNEEIVYVSGMNANHSGFELEGAFQPIAMARINYAISLGRWKYLDNVQGTYKDYSLGTDADVTYEYFVKGLFIGDAPQAQTYFGLTVFPIQGLTIQTSHRYYTNSYAAFSPFGRTDATDVDGEGNATPSWQLPDYGLIDFHASYQLPMMIGPASLSLNFHLFNALDKLYISDATDNSSFNAWRGDGKNHKADDAEVYIGQPRRYNVSLQVRF